jgi:hypothetical protein
LTYLHFFARLCICALVCLLARSFFCLYVRLFVSLYCMSDTSTHGKQHKKIAILHTRMLGCVVRCNEQADAACACASDKWTRRHARIKHAASPATPALNLMDGAFIINAEFDKTWYKRWYTIVWEITSQSFGFACFLFENLTSLQTGL